RGERESRRYRSKTLERSHAAALILDAVLVADQHARRSMSALRQIVQPASALDVRSGKDPADFLGVLVLVITHVHAFVVRQIEDLNLPRVMRHNIFECLLNPAQVPVDAADNLDPSPQRNLEMGGGLHWPALEQVVGPHPDGVALGKRRGAPSSTFPTRVLNNAPPLAEISGRSMA